MIMVHDNLIQEENTMEELYNLVVQKTGLPKEQAKMAVDTVIGFLKTKLPAPIAA
jgi:nucleoid DNA-binding protein